MHLKLGLQEVQLWLFLWLLLFGFFVMAQFGTNFRIVFKARNTVIEKLMVTVKVDHFAMPSGTTATISVKALSIMIALFISFVCCLSQFVLVGIWNTVSIRRNYSY